MHSLPRLARCLALCAFALPALAQNTWYVDVTGNAPGTGTSIDPYTSLQYAINQPATVDHDTLLVRPGTYVENIDNAGKRLTLQSTGGPLVTILKPATTGSIVHLWSPEARFWVVLDGFTVTGYLGGNFQSAAIRSSSGWIRRCIVRDNPTTSGVRVAFDALIVQSTIVRNGTGVMVDNIGYGYLQDSIVWSNTIDVFNTAGAAEARHCAGGVHGPYAYYVEDVGNIDGDPALWDAAQNDFHLRPGSICIDAGDPAWPLDPDGSLRDIGAMPYDASYAPAPAAYCTAKTNSLGCVPSIGATGSASASGSAFTITCANELSHKLGLLFYGLAPKSVAYQGGYLCVQGPVRRTSLLDAGGTIGVDDCSGVYSYDFDALIQSGGDPALVAGELVYAQFWSRDPAASFTSVRSDGLRFGIAP